MNTRVLITRWAAIATVLVAASTADAAVDVVATLPDFGSIAQAVGGDRVKVTSLARGSEDPHFVDARPSFVRVLNRAELLLEGGAELELGWLPPLVQGARNPRIQPGQPGRVNMSQGVELLDVPAGPVTRSAGDVHPAGNPHYWMDPRNGSAMAATIAKALSSVDSANAAHYARNLSAFNKRLEQKVIEWQRIMQPHKGVRIVAYHKSFDYLARAFGLEVVGQLEPKPGIEPSPAHVNALIPKMQAAQVKLILIETFRPRRTPEYVANATDAKVVVLPASVGGHEKVKDYIELFDYAVARIDSALKTAQ